MTRMTSLTASLALAFASGAALAGPVSGDKVVIGVLTDMSGVYSSVAGKGSVAAAEMAVADFGGKVLGKPVSVVFADHQNKADIGVAKAREWFDKDGVDMIADLVNSSVGIGVQKLAGEKKRITINSGAGSTALTNKECTPYGVHYTYDTYAMANGTGRALVKQGLKDWFFITADYAFGQSLERDTTNVVKEMGGKVLGSVRHPLSTADFSSYLLQAQSSGAKAIGLANAGNDFTNAVKQAKEFGLTNSATLAGMLVFDSDIKSLGLPVAQGMMYTTGYYWDMNADTRGFANRFYSKTGMMPNMVQAGVYSSVTTYLKAVQAAGTDDSDAVIKKMKSLPINDFFAKNGKIREDGRMVHDMYLVQVKKPAESKSHWDLLKVLETIPGEHAYQPLSKSECPLIKKS
ncbi:ABC transporter substrate-binding protein [Chitinivorax sp. PXF-14]|uniref:ABC transporter substrate-binding protein n=1 Tax=Chitinivorax sp. PXF-14 TaxID=3230488 RepID=UPI00346688FF